MILNNDDTYMERQDSASSGAYWWYTMKLIQTF